jgi:hypothetical protein
MLYRYRLHWEDGSDAGGAHYAIRIKPVLSGGFRQQRLRAQNATITLVGILTPHRSNRSCRLPGG